MGSLAQVVGCSTSGEICQEEIFNNNIICTSVWFEKTSVIIAQTAYGLSGDREKAIEAGCNDYLSKPIENDVLTGKIQKYFS